MPTKKFVLESSETNLMFNTRFRMIRDARSNSESSGENKTAADWQHHKRYRKL